MRPIDAELLTTNIAQIAKRCAKSDTQKALIGRILFMIENMPTERIIGEAMEETKLSPVHFAEGRQKSLYAMTREISVTKNTRNTHIAD